MYRVDVLMNVVVAEWMIKNMSDERQWRSLYSFFHDSIFPPLYVKPHSEYTISSYKNS